MKFIQLEAFVSAVKGISDWMINVINVIYSAKFVQIVRYASIWITIVFNIHAKKINFIYKEYAITVRNIVKNVIRINVNSAFQIQYLLKMNVSVKKEMMNMAVLNILKWRKYLLKSKT